MEYQIKKIFYSKFRLCFFNQDWICDFLSGLIAMLFGDICHWKSSVILDIFGRNVWFGTKSAIWNQDFWKTQKLHLFHAECHPTILEISCMERISQILCLTACVHIHLCCNHGSILKPSSIAWVSVWKQWNKRNQTGSVTQSILMDLNLQWGVSNSFWKISKFCFELIGCSLRNLIKSGFFCRKDTKLERSWSSSLVISWVVIVGISISFIWIFYKV